MPAGGERDGAAAGFLREAVAAAGGRLPTMAERAPVNAQADRLFAVIVTVDAPASVMPSLLSHARYGLSRFADFDGFLSGTLHISSDGERIVQYLLWETEAYHLACTSDRSWDGLESTRTFMDAVRSGEARMDVRTYWVVDRRDV